jgi:hypothetical protein
MNGFVNIYLRGDQIIIVPNGGGGGVFYEVEPVVVTQTVPQDVTRAIVNALEVSAQASLQPFPDLRKYRSPVLSHLGLKSLRQFYQNIASSAVYRKQSAILIQPRIPALDGKGFQRGSEALTVSDDTGLGIMVIETLQNSPRLNPLKK